MIFSLRCLLQLRSLIALGVIFTYIYIYIYICVCIYIYICIYMPVDVDDPADDALSIATCTVVPCG